MPRSQIALDSHNAPDEDDGEANVGLGWFANGVVGKARRPREASWRMGALDRGRTAIGREWTPLDENGEQLVRWAWEDWSIGSKSGDDSSDEDPSYSDGDEVKPDIKPDDEPPPLASTREPLFLLEPSPKSDESSGDDDGPQGADETSPGVDSSDESTHLDDSDAPELSYRAAPALFTGLTFSIFATPSFPPYFLDF